MNFYLKAFLSFGFGLVLFLGGVSSAFATNPLLEFLAC